MDLPATNGNTGHSWTLEALGALGDRGDTGGAGGHTGRLSPPHRRMLLEESGISAGVVAERGYRTVKSRAELLAFPMWQRRLGLLLPVYSPDGQSTTAQLRPDRPRRDKNGKAIKYDTPSGSRALLDVHPRMLSKIGDEEKGEALWITEGIKKGDSLSSRGRCTISLIGVWNFQRNGELLPCWDHVVLAGRRVYVIFDSDVMVKPEVQLALERLVAALEDRGAEVLVVYLPGPEKGVDDYLVAGGTVEELEALARPYQPEDLGRIRLSRDEELQALVEVLEETFWAHEWKGMGGHSARDVFKELVEAAARHGQVHAGGIRVELSWRTLSERAKVSSRTLGKAITRLEDAGLAYRDNEGRKADKRGAFVLRASVKQVGKKGAARKRTSEEACGPGALHLRAPRLRWSAPRRTIRRGLVRGSRRVRSGVRQHRSGRKRLGKIRGAVLDTLDRAGGTATVKEICAALHRSRPRDLRRRVLPMLEEAGIITVGEDGRVSLADNWLKALERARELGRELEAERLTKARHQRQREAFRNRHRTPRPDRAPSEREMHHRRRTFPTRRRQYIAAAIARLFSERPEYHNRRTGQITCALAHYLEPDFPRGPDGLPKDAEVEAILDGEEPAA
jgi:hypothetical protein